MTFYGKCCCLYFYSQAYGERLPLDHPQLNTLYEWVRLWETAIAQGGLLDVFPVLRFFNNVNHQKITTARQLRKDQMEPCIERTKVIPLTIALNRRVKG